MHEAQVRCQHTLHRVRVDERGRLVFCDHDEPASTLVAAAQAAKIAGRNIIRCGDIALAWRGCERNRLPVALREPFDLAWKRSQARLGRADTAPMLTLHERLVCRTERAAYETLKAANYRRSRDRWVGGDHVVTVNIAQGRVRAQGHKETVWGERGKRHWPGGNSHLNVWIKRDWLFRVQQAGLALVNGIFILDVVGEERGRPLVLAARQGRGFEVHTAAATVVKRDGELKLRWRK